MQAAAEESLFAGLKHGCPHLKTQVTANAANVVSLPVGEGGRQTLMFSATVRPILSSQHPEVAIVLCGNSKILVEACLKQLQRIVIQAMKLMAAYSMKIWCIHMGIWQSELQSLKASCMSPAHISSAVRSFFHLGYVSHFGVASCQHGGGSSMRGLNAKVALCCAQFAPDVQKLAADFMHRYAFLATGRVGSSIDLILQHVEEVDARGKKALLLSLVRAVEVRGTPTCLVKHCQDRSALCTAYAFPPSAHMESFVMSSVSALSVWCTEERSFRLLLSPVAPCWQGDHHAIRPDNV